MRLFIASPVILDDYVSIQKDFKGIIEGKWVEEGNLHLTWVFLGDVDDPRPLLEKLRLVKPLSQEVPVCALGYFGRPPRVLFAKAESKILYDKAWEFKEAGFDLCRFKPHVTLCRIKKVPGSAALTQKVKEFEAAALGLIKPGIHLYHSTLTENGPIYSKLS